MIGRLQVVSERREQRVNVGRATLKAEDDFRNIIKALAEAHSCEEVVLHKSVQLNSQEVMPWVSKVLPRYDAMLLDEWAVVEITGTKLPCAPK